MNPKQIEEFFHLTPVQKHLLRQSEQAAEPESSLAQFACHLTGPLDVSAFERAWQKVTNRQPGLRMTYISGDLKEPVQVINRNVGVELEKLDWRNLAAADQQHRLQELLQAEQQTRFVLKTPPLWRLLLIRLTEERFYFVWTYHELLLDEASLPLVFNEVLTTYDAILRGKNETLPLPHSWRKYVEWSRKQNVDEAAQFWRTSLQQGWARASSAWGLTETESSASLEVTTVDRLKRLAAEARVSVEVLVQGAWALLLSRLTGQADVLFGITVAARPADLHAADRLIGHCQNVLPLHVRIPPAATVREYLTQLQTQREALRAYELNALTQIQSWCDWPEEVPLLQSVLVVDAGELEASLYKQIAGLEITPERLALPNHFPLIVMVKEDASGWQLASNEQVAAPLRHWLEQFAAHPDRVLAELQIVTAVSATPTIAAEPARPADVPVAWQPFLPVGEDEQGWVTWLKNGICAHELFEERAARTPEAVAVQAAGQAMTYRELNARANQLAHYLRKLHVQPSIPVGLCVTLSPDAWVGMLAVLKAGGAYVPLDPSLSSYVLQRQLDEAGVTLILTQEALEPKFRTIFGQQLVLCLDNDWRIIADEETDNLPYPVSDEHPACMLVEADALTIRTHAQLAQAVRAATDWFRLDNDNPWHLAGTLPPAITPETTPVLPPEPLANNPLFDVLAQPIWDETPLEELELLPLPELEPEEEPGSDVLYPLSVTVPQLAPIQQWFFAHHPLEPQHWNLSLLVEINELLERATLEQALHTVVAQHEALRWRFTPEATGWQVREAVAEATLPFEYVDFSAKWARSQRRAIEETAEQLQTSLHLSAGPLWRVAYFDLGPNRAHRLLVIFHHLIGDEASLRLFLTDLLEAYRHLQQGHARPPAPGGASYFQWVQATRTSNDTAYWQQVSTTMALPVDHPEGANTYGQMERVWVSLNSAETESLLHVIPHVANAEVNELVLTALAVALADWTGNDTIAVELERNARHEVAGLDVARTIGWFAVRFPVRLTVDSEAALEPTLRALQTQLRAIPAAGFGYGWWRYGSAFGTTPGDFAAPPVSFRYLEFPPAATAWHPASETVGHEQHPHNERSVALSVTGALNLNMLEFQWSYARAQFEQRNIGILVNRFIAELRRLIQQFSPQQARAGE